MRLGANTSMGPGILRVLKLKVRVACRDLRVASSRYSKELRTADRELRVHIDMGSVLQLQTPKLAF